MASRYANGHRRRQVRRQVLAEESVCWLCNKPVDKSLGKIPGVHTERCAKPDCRGCKRHPLSPEVDEILPVSLGGSPIDRNNCRLAHRICNERRGNGTRIRKTPTTQLRRVREW